MQMYGCTHDEWQKLDAAGLPDAYRAQRKNARVRGIGFLLTFSEWLQVWRESGKLDERGRTGGCYVMSRRGDVGPYAIGNVFIQLHAENVKEGFAIKRQAKNYRHQDERDLQTAACM